MGSCVHVNLQTEVFPLFHSVLQDVQSEVHPLQRGQRLLTDVCHLDFTLLKHHKGEKKISNHTIKISIQLCVIIYFEINKTNLK